MLAESVVVQRDLGDRAGLAFVLERLAIVAATHGLAERALRLAGASSALRELLGIPLNPAARSGFDARLAPAWQSLRAELAALAWQQGRAMSAERAIALALEPDGAASVGVDHTSALHPAVGQLTPREREVAVLVARGLTNRQIAGTLVIAERTADVHVSNILNKLTLTSRLSSPAWVVRHGLLD